MNVVPALTAERDRRRASRAAATLSPAASRASRYRATLSGRSRFPPRSTRQRTAVSMTRLFRSSNFASASSASSSATKSSRRLAGDDERFVEGHRRGIAATLLRAPGAGVVHEDATHHAGRHREEVRAVVPGDVFRVDQPEVCLVDERRRLQAVSRAFVGHVAPRDLVELLVDERNQSLQGVGVALAPFEKQRGDVRLTRRDAAILGPFRRFNFLAAVRASRTLRTLFRRGTGATALRHLTTSSRTRH